MNPIVSGVSFPAIKGKQAKTEYYIVMCPLKRLNKIFSLDEGQLPVDQRAQRILNEERIPDITNYILEGRENMFFLLLQHASTELVNLSLSVTLNMNRK